MLQVEELDDNHWKLISAFTYFSKQAGPITVPVGFITDFASIPRVPLVFMLFGNTAHSAAVIHDYLYTTGQVSRKIADKVFLEAMASAGDIPFWKRWPMYCGVRLFGGSAWSKHRSETSNNRGI